MPALQNVPSFSLADYDALPDTVRAEVYDGEVIYLSSPSQEHQTTLTELLVTIRSYCISRQSGR